MHRYIYRVMTNKDHNDDEVGDDDTQKDKEILSSQMVLDVNSSLKCDTIYRPSCNLSATLIVT